MESNHGQSFLGNDASEYDDFAALDSMGYTGTQSSGASLNFGSGAAAGGGVSSMGSGGSAVGDGRENGFPGVSGSLFDRIRARTAEEQQKKQQQQQQSSSLPPPSTAAAAQSREAPATGQSSQQHMQQPQYTQQQQPSAFASQQQRQHYGVEQPATDPSETTYSFAGVGGGGEDFSPAPPRVPTYGASRSDPYYAAMGGQQQPPGQPASVLARTGEAAWAVLGAGLGAARSIGELARDKIGGGAAGAGGGRSYNNNFLLREDSVEGGLGGSAASGPPPAAASAGAAPPGPSSEAAIGASDQAYSMMKYAKTFCEDLFLFFMDLPTWGKVLMGLIVLWGLYIIFDS